MQVQQGFSIFAPAFGAAFFANEINKSVIIGSTARGCQPASGNHRGEQRMRWAGYNLRWLMWAMARLGLKADFLRLYFGAVIAPPAGAVGKIRHHRFAVAGGGAVSMATSGL